VNGTDLSKTDMRAEGLMAQPVGFLVGQVLDVPLHVFDARTKRYRDTIAYDGPFLDVNCESACGAVCVQVID
jgi:hypothetical protein